MVEFGLETGSPVALVRDQNLTGAAVEQAWVGLEHVHRDVAFVGGIDLCHSRRDDAAHEGDPQPVSIDARYGGYCERFDVPRGKR